MVKEFDLKKHTFCFRKFLAGHGRKRAHKMCIWMLYVGVLSILVPQASSQLCFTFIVFVVTVQNDCLLVCCCEKDELFAEIA